VDTIKIQYKHTQIVWLTLYTLGGGLVFCLILLVLQVFNPGMKGFNPALFMLAGILAVSLLLFYKLTITIDRTCINIRFGTGIIRKTFILKDIAGLLTVKNHWYYGWGIHHTPCGWLYNVSGLHAVEITTKSGRKYRLGTDEPDALEKAIRSSLP